MLYSIDFENMSSVQSDGWEFLRRVRYLQDSFNSLHHANKASGRENGPGPQRSQRSRQIVRHAAHHIGR